MAGDWIKIEHGILGKPEVMRLCDLLDCGPHQVVGHLVAFWLWCDVNMSSICPRVMGTKRGLDSVAGRDGFCDAMIAVGWLSVEDGEVWVPNYETHLSKSAKQRAGEQRKKALQRSGMSPSQRDKAGTDAGTKSGLEKRRGEEEKKDISHPCENSSGGGSEVMIPKELADLWPKWTQHHLIKTGQPIGEPQQEAILLDLAKRGWDKARADILFSMRIGASTVRDSENDFDKNAKKSASSKPEPKKEKELPMITELPPEIVAIYTRQAEERRKRNEEFERKRHDESVRRSVDLRDPKEAV